MHIPPGYNYGDWVHHAGVEDACNRLALWSVHGGRLWLTSASPAGKTHLMQTVAGEHKNIRLLHVKGDADAASSQQVELWMQALQEQASWMIDVEAGAPSLAVSHALFHCLERARDLQRPVAIAWRGDIEGLPDELASRLRAMDAVRLSAPVRDDELLALLRACAGHLQWDIREQVLLAMLRYLPRQLDVLLPALKELERLSFEQKHKPGPAWLKQQLLRISAHAE